MPRTARKQGESSVYHVVQRGVGQQIIFEDDWDRLFYLELLVRFDESACGGPSVLAWCLMSNHVHLLVRMPIEDLSRFMKRVGVAYARHFNDRHSRTGALFQGRFASEPVDTDEYLMTVVRYIHANPLGAGCATMADWRWSSYGEYVADREAVVASTAFVLDVFGGRRAFEEFHLAGHEGGDPIDVDIDGGRPRNDEDALDVARGVLGGVGIHELKGMEKAERDEWVVALRGAGLSVRQIARLSGLGVNIVARARSGAREE